MQALEWMNSFPKPETFRISLRRQIVELTSGARVLQRGSMPGNHWIFQLVWGMECIEKNAAFLAWLKELFVPQRVVKLPLMLEGYCPAIEQDRDFQVCQISEDRRILECQGLPSDFYMPIGQYVTINHSLKRIVGGATADGYGRATLEVEPEIRLNGEKAQFPMPVISRAPYGLFKVAYPVESASMLEQRLSDVLSVELFETTDV